MSTPPAKRARTDVATAESEHAKARAKASEAFKAAHLERAKAKRAAAREAAAQARVVKAAEYERGKAKIAKFLLCTKELTEEQEAQVKREYDMLEDDLEGDFAQHYEWPEHHKYFMSLLRVLDPVGEGVSTADKEDKEDQEDEEEEEEEEEDKGRMSVKEIMRGEGVIKGRKEEDQE